MTHLQISEPAKQVLSQSTITSDRLQLPPGLSDELQALSKLITVAARYRDGGGITILLTLGVDVESTKVDQAVAALSDLGFGRVFFSTGHPFPTADGE